MDPEFLKSAVPVINMLGTFALGVWMYLERRNDKTNDRVTELAGKVEKLDKDVTALESTAASAPSHADIARVYDSVNDLSRTVHQLVGENRGQTDTLRLILNRITEKGMP